MDAFLTHLPRIEEFWKFQLLGHDAQEKFDIIKKHQVFMLRKGELDRWIFLLNETLTQVKRNYQSVPNIDSLVASWEEKIIHFKKVFEKTLI